MVINIYSTNERNATQHLILLNNKTLGFIQDIKIRYLLDNRFKCCLKDLLLTRKGCKNIIKRKTGPSLS